ncbi:fluoride efflux transporter FluC, partial [Thiohalocapsa halophila]
MLQLIAIAGGGALGALARFFVSTGVYRVLGRDFPWGTLSVNVLGSFAMGLLFVLLLERSLLAAELRAAILIGFLG